MCRIKESMPGLKLSGLQWKGVPDLCSVEAKNSLPIVV